MSARKVLKDQEQKLKRIDQKNKETNRIIEQFNDGQYGVSEFQKPNPTEDTNKASQGLIAEVPFNVKVEPESPIKNSNKKQPPAN